MLSNLDASANLAVKDLAAARKFYEQTLGFEPVETMGEELVEYRSGSTTFNVYRSEMAGSNKATAVTWEANDIEGIVRDLKSKGINFEHYDMPGDMPGLSRQGDIHEAEGMKVVWFKDPDGNILNVISR
jgi:catechol 2,3-dioxygenase-like lactoylglutathione lyase family enzyme